MTVERISPVAELLSGEDAHWELTNEQMEERYHMHECRDCGTSIDCYGVEGRERGIRQAWLGGNDRCDCSGKEK